MADNYKKLYYDTLIELLELKIKNGIDIDKNLKLLKHIIVKALKSNNDLKLFRSLSKREDEVLSLILNGKNNTEIADFLYISVNTVKKHVHGILNKSGCLSRFELISKGNIN